MADGSYIPARAALIEAPAATAWTTYEDLTAEQRARFGGYVKAKDEARRQVAYRIAQNKAANDALVATGGDKVAALGLLLKVSGGEVA